MQYKSPIKFISIFLHENEKIEHIDLTLLKKRILAEYELSGKITFQSDIGELNKSEVIQLFNDLDKKQLEYHIIIHQIPELLFFLEYNSLDGKLNFQNKSFDNEGFVNFVVPFLAHSLGVFFSDCIKNQNPDVIPLNFQQLPKLGKNTHIMQAHVQTAIEKLIEKMDSIQSHLNDATTPADLWNIFSQDLIEVLNKLPKGAFSTAIDTYANAGINLIGEFLVKKGSRSFKIKRVRFIYKQLKKLSLQPETKNKLNELGPYLFYSPVEENEKKNKGAGTLIFIVVVIIFILIKSAASDSRRSTRYNYDINKMPIYQSIEDKKNIDSILIHALKRERKNYNNRFSESSKKMLDSLIKTTERRMDSLKHLLNDSIKQKTDSLTIDSTIPEKDDVFIPLAEPIEGDSLNNDSI